MKEALADRAAMLLDTCRVAALATAHDTAPSVSMVPYAIVDEPFTLIILVSALASHTTEMRANANVALMIMQPEDAAQAPHSLARVSMQGTARAISPGEPRYATARAAYSARFAEMAGLFELGDFTLFAITPGAVRVVAGFAQAASITPDALARSVLALSRGG